MKIQYKGSKIKVTLSKKGERLERAICVRIPYSVYSKLRNDNVNISKAVRDILTELAQGK